MPRKLRLSFHETPLRPRGPESISVNYPPTVAQESTTVKKHEAHIKTDTKREKKGGEQREEEIQLTRHQTHYKRKAVNTTTTTIMMRNDTLVFGSTAWDNYSHCGH